MKNLLLKIVPWCLVAVFAAEILSILVPRPDKDFHIQEFGRLPVLLNGRVQPIDSVGRNTLLQIRNTAAVPLEEKKSYEFWKHPKKLKATEWAMEVMMKPELADTRPVFLIHHPELINELDLRGKGIEKSGLYYFTFNQLTNCIDKIEREGQQVMQVDAQQRTAYQKQVANLYNALTLYRRLKNSLQPEDTQDFVAELEQLHDSMHAGMMAIKAQQAGQPYDTNALNTYVGLLHPYETMSRVALPLLVPPSDPVKGPNAWRNMGDVLFEVGVGRAEPPPALGYYARMATAFDKGQPGDFNKALAEYQQWLNAGPFGSETAKGSAEVFFNNLQAFLHAMIIYLFAFLVAVLSLLSVGIWPNGAEMLRRSAFYMTVLALMVHTAGLFFRMWLEKRPPVTNLYSSAVFIGWMVVVLGVILERIYKVGIGVAASSFIGFITLIIAHNLANAGDTMEMMRAVLDSNFWLSTHVVTVTLGYAAMFLAGMLAVTYVFAGFFTPLLGRDLKQGELGNLAMAGAAVGGSVLGAAVMGAGLIAKRQGITIGQALTKMVYGIVCFATLFSFVGTVLGGIWADQSWGRFWGWDPKENGALLIVIWCGVILHARWGGMIRERGLMALAIGGNIITAWSWFGVNMLGVGLHSYGFMDSAFKWLVVFVASQLVIIAISLLPLKWWRSFRDTGEPTPAVTT
jgi:ABC-type transport system involved in cytochrome c biogenesis permease subunit